MKASRHNSQLIRLVLVLALSIPAAVIIGCGEDDAAPAASSVEVSRTEDGGEESYGGDEDKVVVVAGDDTYVVVGDPGEECVELDNGDCIDLSDAKERYCDEEGAQADVVVVDGEVVEVICYPDDDGGTPIEEVVVDGDGNAEVPQNQSGSVIIFNEDTNGEPIEGDVNLEAERTTLYGNGVDETILDGNLRVESNNSRVRGVTITGNVKVEKNSNNMAMAFCKIHGDLTVDSNGSRIVNCQVFGNVDVTGNDTTLINIGVGKEWKVNDKTICDGCYSFDNDDSVDFEVEEDEVGDDLACSRNLSDVEEN